MGAKPTQEQGGKAIYLVPLEGDAAKVAAEVVLDLEGEPTGDEPLLTQWRFNYGKAAHTRKPRELHSKIVRGHVLGRCLILFRQQAASPSAAHIVRRTYATTRTDLRAQRRVSLRQRPFQDRQEP